MTLQVQRLVKLKVMPEEQNKQVLRLAKNLCDKKDKGPNKVYEHQDMTTKQRQQRMKLYTK
jgi:hypothetical protein